MKIKVASKQIVGDRNAQEDAVGHTIIKRLFNRNQLLMLADGMGGHAAGDVASELTIKAFSKTLERSNDQPRHALKQGLTSANEAIARRAAEEPSLEGMGTTLIAALITKQDLHWISVGDSHLYLFRDQSLQKLNDDHSMAPVLAKLVEQGEMTEQDAAEDPSRHALRSALGGADIPLIDLQSKTGLIEPKDIIILASDGLDTISESNIKSVVSDQRKAGPSGITAGLVDAVSAVKKPNQDNTSVVVCQVG